MIDNTTDLDGDGVPDVNDDELNSFGCSSDSDGDGIPNATDLDDDNDGIPDAVETSNVPDPINIDSDNDGIDDSIDVDQTGGEDNNGDGISTTIRFRLSIKKATVTVTTVPQFVSHNASLI